MGGASRFNRIAKDCRLFTGKPQMAAALLNA
jgi:hypothetical protein